MDHNLVLVRASRQYILASTLLRFQEYYESPQFRGKIFNLEEFMDWYASQRGNFTYYKDWAGFNIPSKIFKPFREGKFNPLFKKEAALLELLVDIPEPFYLAGIYGKKIHLSTLKHELVHGLFYLNSDYGDKVLDVLGKSKIDAITSILQKMGYDSSVWLDEANAYLTTGLNSFKEYGLERTPEIKELQEVMRNIFQSNFGFSIKQAGEDQILSCFKYKLTLPVPRT